MNNDFTKTLKDYNIRIIYLPELPSKDIKVEENTMVAIPGEEKGQYKFYTWSENEWVYIPHSLTNLILNLKNLKMLTMI